MDMIDVKTEFGAGGAATTPTSPVSARHGPPNGAPKRKRSSTGGAIDSSPDSLLHDDDHHHVETEKKRQPGVKRACNECRQQKLRCDVVQDPFTSCSRCTRLKLECKIESNFKRIGKRSKHAEMEKEIERLRRNVARAQAQGYMLDDDDEIHSQLQSPIATSVYTHTRNTSLMGSDDVVSSLLHLKQGGGSYQLPRYHELENVRLTDDTVMQLFTEYWSFYHPFLPFLNPSLGPDQYKQQHELLFWTIIAIASRRNTADPTLLEALTNPLTRLLWRTIGEVPSNYYVIKALCLICTWPLPTSTTTSDPTHILCGVMMKSATGIGLHRPSHTQDFSRVSVELNKEQLHDRVVTWAVCNIVAQTIGTGYGQPASTLYDWTLAVRPGEDSPFTLPQEIEMMLQIQRFCDKVSKEMYSNAMDPRGVAGDEHRAMLMRVYRRDFGELQAAILSNHPSAIIKLHLKAAHLHLRLAGFFDSSTTPSYMDDLMGLWRATISFLDTFLDEGEVTSPGSNVSQALRYCTNYIQQMLVAAGFALLKLLRSFFARSIDLDRGRSLFHRTLQAIRTTSVIPNDLQWKLAELMAQMYNGSRLDQQGRSHPEEDTPVPMDDTLQLKVRCRHSMSLVFDSIWRWREDYQAQGRGSLDALKHPTNPDSAAESSASSTTHLESTLMAPTHPTGLQSSLLAATTNGGGGGGALTPGATGGIGGSMIGGTPYGDAAAGAPGYDLWDPNHWMLDNLLDFNYGSYVQPAMEGA